MAHKEWQQCLALSACLHICASQHCSHMLSLSPNSSLSLSTNVYWSLVMSNTLEGHKEGINSSFRSEQSCGQRRHSHSNCNILQQVIRTIRYCCLVERARDFMLGFCLLAWLVLFCFFVFWDGLSQIAGTYSVA
jgi:hypothetical protein